MDKIGNSPVLLGVLALILYGVTGPMLKVAGNYGVTTNGMAFLYGLGALICAANFSGETKLFNGWTGLAIMAVAGILYGIAFRVFARAISLPNGHVSIVPVIVSGFPLVSTVIAVVFMDEAGKVSMAKVIIGSLLVISGVAVMATASKN